MTMPTPGQYQAALAAQAACLRAATVPHIEGCAMWHHQGGDYDRDCASCMDLAAVDQYLAKGGQPVMPPVGDVAVEDAGPVSPVGEMVEPT